MIPSGKANTVRQLYNVLPQSKEKHSKSILYSTAISPLFQQGDHNAEQDQEHTTRKQTGQNMKTNCTSGHKPRKVKATPESPP